MSIDTVKNRINRLEDKGIIEGYTSVISYKKLGYSLKASILIGLHNITQKRYREFIQALKSDRQVIVLNSIAGNFDIEAIVIAEGSEDLEKFSKNVRTNFTEIIDSWQTNIITKTHQIEKFEYNLTS